MSALPRSKMTVAEFLVWAEGQTGRHELVRGEVHAMAPERAGHSIVKVNVYNALRQAIAGAGCRCHALPDGITVEIDDDTSYEPDALVYCGDPIDLEAITAPAPVIVVEVLSPSTKSVDTGEKLADYFRLPSVKHYLVVHPRRMPVTHHARQADGTILTRLIASGTIKLDPPGIEFSVDGLLA
jgi:Uma2 family endonuclease